MLRLGALVLTFLGGAPGPVLAQARLCVLGPLAEPVRMQAGVEATLHCTCPSKIEFFMNADRGYEVAFAWPVDGLGGTESGAFAESYEIPDTLAGGWVCQIVLGTTDDGRGLPGTADLYVWSNAAGAPGEVLGMLPGRGIGVAPEWPNVVQRPLEVYEIQQIGVQGRFWVGARISGPDSTCSVYLGGDSAGEEPTTIRDGRSLALAGEPIPGWQDFDALWERPVALGIGVMIGWCPLPVEERSWGAIKSLYR